MKKAQAILNSTDVQLSDSILQSMEDDVGKLSNDSEEYRRRVLYDEEKPKSVSS